MSTPDRTDAQANDDRRRLGEAVQDGIAVAQAILREPERSLALPAIISAVITSKSLGGLMKRLFGVSNRDIPYNIQSDTYPLVTLAAVGSQAISTFSVTQDSDFYAQRMGITSGNAGAGAFDFTLQLLYNSSDRRWSSRQNGGHVLAYQGTGQRPFVFPQPLYVPRNSQLSVSITQIAATANTVFVDLIGRKTVDVNALDLTTRRWGA